MNNNLILLSILKRKVTFFAIFIVLAAGIFSYITIPKQEIPDVSAPAAVITTIYPGGSSSEIEQLVTTPIEDKIADLTNIKKLESTSVSNLSIVAVEFDVNADADKVLADLRRKVDGAKTELPDGAMEPDIDTDLTDTPSVILSFSGESYSNEQLVDYADYYKKRLVNANGVRKVEIEGEIQKQIKVNVDHSKLESYRLSLEDILMRLQGQNVSISSGSLGKGRNEIMVKTEGLFQSLQEINDTIIDVSSDTGELIRVRDLADVYFEEKDRNLFIRNNGHDAVVLAIYFKESQNTIKIGKNLKTELDELKKKVPSDLIIERVVFQPDEVAKSISNFITSLIIGVVLVIAVAFIGMGWRSAIIISTSLPLAIFATFTAMRIGGIKLEQISIAGLIIALGMLVDNSVVVSDSISKRLESGEDRLKACVNGTKEVALPMFASLLTVLTAFTPLLIVPGAAGDFLSSLPKVVMISLIVSYIIALLIIPPLSYVALPIEQSAGEKGYLTKVYQFFVGAHGFVASKKILVPIMIGGLFTATIMTQSLLGLSFFPKADKEMLYIDVLTEESSDIKVTKEVVNKIEVLIQDEPEIINYTSAIGGSLPKFYLTVIRGGESPENAQVMMNIDLSAGERFQSKAQLVDYLQMKLDKSIPGVEAVVKEIEQGPPGGAPIQVRVTGDDLIAIKNIAKTVAAKLTEIPGAMNVTESSKDQQYQYLLNIDTNLATQVGLSRYDIQKQVAVALNGFTSSTFRSKKDEYDLVVTSNIQSMDELENLYIKSNVTEAKIPLKQIATVEIVPQLSSIKKFDRQFVVEVHGYAMDGYSPVEIQNSLEQEMKTEDTRGVMLTFAGEKQNIDENFGAAVSFAFIAIAVMFVIMFVQFNSFIQPLIIFISIPLALFGSFLGLYLFRQPLSFTVVLGIISLCGIVINNAIILTDFINREIKEGKSISEATANSVKDRVRPILIGATTTVFGLLPLALSSNSLFRPMAIALMFGILMSTVLTLILIPVINEIVLSMYNKLKKGEKQ